MKKAFLFLGVSITMILAACGDTKESTEDKEDSDANVSTEVSATETVNAEDRDQKDETEKTENKSEDKADGTSTKALPQGENLLKEDIVYEERVRRAVQSALEPLEEMEVTVEGLRKGFGRMIANLPEMLNNFKPYIDTAIFEPGKYENVRLYNVSALAILDEMELLFNDIIYQLSNEKANAIEATLEISQYLKR